MSFKNAEANIKKLAESLTLPSPKFKEGECSLKCSENIFIHFSFDEESGLLYIYTSILDALPPNPNDKAIIYEEILKDQLLFSSLTPGKIGLDEENNMILFFETLPMENAKDEELLFIFPSFVRMAEVLKEILDLSILKADAKKEFKPPPKIKGLKI